MKMSNSPSLPCRNKRYLHFKKEKMINPVIINIKFYLPQKRENEIQSKLGLENCWVSKQ